MADEKDLQKDVLEHIKASHAALDAAKTQMDKQAAVEAKVAELAPGVVQRLIEHGRVFPEFRDKLAADLRDPVKVLELLGRIADPAVGTKAAAIGTPAGPAVKQANRVAIIDARDRPTEADGRYSQGVAALAARLGHSG